MKKNIVLNQFTTLNNYFINENGIITDENGVVQEIHSGERPYFKRTPIHRIMMYTFYEYRDGHKWDIHHIDGNKQNNKLENLVYLTHSEHAKLHQKNNKAFLGKHHSTETKKKISELHKGKKLTEETKKKMSDNHVGMNGRHHSSETRRKISEAMKAAFARKKLVN